MKNNDDKVKNEEKQDEQAGEQVLEEETDKEIEELKQKAEECENKYKRALADYQNLQKRTQDEKQDWILSANKELLLRFLPVLDTLIIAHHHVQDEGLKITIDQFLGILKAEGVTKIETIGKEFDPEFMEVVMTGEGKDGIVLENLRNGYMINKKLLRPAQVKVGKKMTDEK